MDISFPVKLQKTMINSFNQHAAYKTLTIYEFNNDQYFIFHRKQLMVTERNLKKLYGICEQHNGRTELDDNH